MRGMGVHLWGSKVRGVNQLGTKEIDFPRTELEDSEELEDSADINNGLSCWFLSNN